MNSWVKLYQAHQAIRQPGPTWTSNEALDWVISQLVPTAAFEPAPWANVETALKEASS